jgi:hypothetical protein
LYYKCNYLTKVGKRAKTLYSDRQKKKQQPKRKYIDFIVIMAMRENCSPPPPPPPPPYTPRTAELLDFVPLSGVWTVK